MTNKKIKVEVFSAQKYKDLEVQITSYNPGAMIHDAGTYLPKSDATYHYLNISRFITLTYLI